MAGESNVALAVIESLRRVRDLAAVKGVAVHVENLRAVERDLDLLAAHFDLLVVPSANRAQVAVLGADAMIERAVVLIGKERVILLVFEL